jgi:type III secretion system FlhB-like substrate exporter
MRKAVALKYSSSVPAPYVAAKGGGSLALRLLRIAEENGIIVRHEPELTEGLFAFDAGTCVPPVYYEAIAEIFAFIFKLRESP